MWENFAAGSLALFSDPFTIAIFVFGKCFSFLANAICFAQTNLLAHHTQ